MILIWLAVVHFQRRPS